jgi:hypothetical protein
MIKMLIKVISIFVTWGVTALPPEKKSRPEIYEGGGVQETM